MARILRHEHTAAALGIGENVHRQIRRSFAASWLVRAWAIDGELNALGGVTGAVLSPVGYVWMGISDRFRRYPRYVVKEARSLMDEALRTKLELRTVIYGGDEAALRFAIYLGFVTDETPQAFSHHGRRLVLNCLRDDPEMRVPHGSGFGVPMYYDGVAA